MVSNMGDQLVYFVRSLLTGRQAAKEIVSGGVSNRGRIQMMLPVYTRNRATMFRAQKLSDLLCIKFVQRWPMPHEICLHAMDQRSSPFVRARIQTRRMLPAFPIFAAIARILGEKSFSPRFSEHSSSFLSRATIRVFVKRT